MNRASVLLPTGMFALALALFLTTLSHHLPTGANAHAVACQLGALPFAPVESPLWGLWVNFTALFLPQGGISVLNAGNALLGACAVALTAWICSRIPHDRSHEEKRTQLNPVRAAWISGVAAAVVLATTPAFWFAATRACPEVLGITLLLLSALIWLRALARDQTSILYPGCVLLGVGCVEYASFFLFLPLFLALILAHGLRRRRIRWRVFLGCLACFLLGYSVILYAAQVVWTSPSAAWRGYDSYWDCLWAVFRQQKVILVRSIPKVGWLLLFLLSFAPLLMVIVPKERLQRSTRWPSYFLHLTLSALALLLLFNTWISLYGQYRLHVLVVASAVVNALWIGYLAGYWWCVFHSHSRLESGFAGGAKRLASRLWPALLAVVLGLAAYRSHELIDARHTAWTDGYADYLLEHLPDQALLASGTPVEPILAIKAWRTGRNIRLLNPGLASASSYIGYAGTLWEQPRLRSLAAVGPMAVLAEWIKLAPDQAAAQMRSDFYDSPNHAAGWESIPAAPFYLPRAKLDGVDLDALAAALDDWARRPFMAQALTETHPEAYADLEHWLRISSSKFANNLGVLSERMGRIDLADRHYRQARLWNPQNPSALLNVADLARRHPPADAADLQSELDAFLAARKEKFALFSLSHVHGQIARPEAYVERGLAWAVSGRPNLAVGEIRRAMQLSEQDDHFRLLLAFLQFGDAEAGDGEPVIREILAKEPANLTALSQLARIHASRGDLASARALLGRALESQPKSPTLRLQQVGLELLGGEEAAGLALLKQLTADSPDNLQAWALLALLAQQAGDPALALRAEEHLARRDDLTTPIRLVIAEMRRRRNDLPEARILLEDTLRRDRSNPVVHDQLLRVLYLERNRYRAREVVRDLLRLDPGHAFGNLMNGSIQFEDGDLEYAEASFRASLRTSPSAEALNSLAFILSQKGRNEEALVLAQQADVLQPGDPSILDTLAVIHLGLGNLPVAQEFARKAVALAADNAEIALHLALVLEKSGEAKEALSICQDLFNRVGQVPPRLQTTLLDLRARLDRAIPRDS